MWDHLCCCISSLLLLLLSRFHCIYVPQFVIHSPINGHLDCFQVLAIRKCVSSFFVKFLFLLGRYLGVGLLGLIASVYFNIKRNCWIVFLSLSFCIPTSNVWEFQLLYILNSIWNYFNYVVILHCVLICISLMTNDTEHHFLWSFNYADV